MSESYKVQITVVKAVNVPRSGTTKQNCYVQISIGSEVQKTTPAKGSNPAWNEHLVFNSRPEAEVKIQVIHAVSDRHIAEATTLLKREYFGDGYIPTDEFIKLHLAVATIFPRGNPAVTLSFSVIESSSTHVSTPASPIQGISENITLLRDQATGVTLPKAMSDRVSQVTKYIDILVQIGDSLSEVNPYAKVAFKLLTAGYNIYKAQCDRNAKVLELWDSISDTLDFMDDAEPLKVIRGVEKTTRAIMEQLQECLSFLHQRGMNGFSEKVKGLIDSSEAGRLDSFIRSFGELKVTFTQKVTLDHWKIVRATNVLLDSAERRAQAKQLRSLPGAHLSGVQWDPDHACLPDTRTKLLADIVDWIDSGSGYLLWLSGAAGTGKSSVANSVAEIMESKKQLGASFRFRRDTTMADTPSHLFGNIACQLAFHNNQIWDAILEAIDQHESYGATSLKAQSENLVVKPLQNAILSEPLVIIIDALDESGADHDVQGKPGRHTLVKAIKETFQLLPSFVKVFVTSREEGSIADMFSDTREISHVRMADVEGTQDDIRKYVDHQLTKIAKRAGLPDTWPGTEKEAKLVFYADNLFIWADVACSFLKDDPQSKLNQLFRQFNSSSIKAESPLDKLYTQILTNFNEQDDDLTLNNWQFVFGVLAVIKKPLNTKTLDSLLGLPLLEARALLNGKEIELSSTKYITSKLLPLLLDQEESIRFLHKSVFDFLTKRASSPFLLDISMHNSILAIDCLKHMNKNLKYNICEVENTSLLNTQISELAELLHRHIPQALEYACVYFTTHLLEGSSKRCNELLAMIDIFLTENVLFWIEVMGWLHKLPEAQESLKLVLQYLDIENANLIEITNNCISLIQRTAQAIDKAPLQTYMSGLALCPSSTPLHQQYCANIKTPWIASSHSTWSSAVAVLKHQDHVHVAVFSPDGTKLASASSDHTVCLWDVQSGTIIGSAMDGHSDSVNSVVFSPDGTKLASASDDHTIYRWDVLSGMAIGSALEGHSDRVYDVVFSPDGTKLASASGDCTIRLWNVQSGTTIGSALAGHTSAIYSVTFSPDGTKLASASNDHTVHLWDVNAGTAIEASLDGHSNQVNSVVFSPDGTKLASASWDGLVGLWDIQSETAIGSLLQGHSSGVNSVRFSPDSNKLASASEDHTIHLWDIESGMAISKFALNGHSDSVYSVVFSPDSTKLASASGDCTLYLWDVLSGTAIGTALEGHNNQVNSVMFSPDGKKLASAANDYTARLWDVQSHTAFGSTLEGHTSVVYDVAFSPDGTKLASASGDQTVVLWDVQSGKAISTLKGHTNVVCGVVFSSDGTKLASQDLDLKIHLWDVHSRCSLGSALVGSDSIQSVVFSPDGTKLASSYWDGMITLWDIQSETGIGSNLEGHSGCVNSVIFSPDGKKLASASDDHTVCLWDVQSCTVIGSALEGHSDRVTSVVFSPDGTKLASASWDYTVHLWDVQSGMSIGSPLEGHSSLAYSVVFSSDGTKLASASFDDTVCLWDIQSGISIGTSHKYESGYPICSHDSAKQSSYEADLQLSICSFCDVYEQTVWASRLEISHEISDGFLLSHTEKQCIWLPAHLAGKVYKGSDSTFVVTGPKGPMTFVRF